MCLRIVEKRYKPKECKRRFGWKEFRIKNDQEELISRFTDWGKGVLPIGRFLYEKNYRIYKDVSKIVSKNEEEYNVGWHIGLKKPDVNQMKQDSRVVIKRVEFKNAHTLGIDDSYGTQTIVAKYMKILD